jgi:hypothetical protein
MDLVGTLDGQEVEGIRDDGSWKEKGTVCLADMVTVTRAD